MRPEQVYKLLFFTWHKVRKTDVFCAIYICYERNKSNIHSGARLAPGGGSFCAADHVYGRAGAQ